MPPPDSTEDVTLSVELERESFERLRRLAAQEELSIPDVLQKAVVEYVRTHLELDPDDPLFDATPGMGEKAVDARSLDESLAETIEGEGSETEGNHRD